jgi:cell division protein ZapA
MKQIEVQIMGQSYLLGCPADGESQLRSAVDHVDAAMCKIRDAGKVKARDRIAVLASLNIAFDLIQAQAASASAAEVAVAPVAAAGSPVAPLLRMATPSDTANHAELDDPRLPQLLQRLDNALAGDGHLL